MTDPEAATHDYTRRMWGHDFTIHDVIDGGRELRCSGWGPCVDTDPLKPIRTGDYLILPGEEPRTTTRYQVAEVQYHRDPDDMWAATLRFAPRDPMVKDPS